MKLFLITGSILAATTVIFGAFGAHALKTRISLEDLNIFETAVRYQMYHALGIILVGIMGFHLPHESLSLPTYFIAGGIIIFSGSLYLLIFTQLRWLGAITPLGGAGLILGWILLAISIYKS